MEGGTPAGPPPAPSVGPWAAAAIGERNKKIERTQSGLLLLIVADLLLWIPYIQILGLIIGAVAVILILLGAEAFGFRHQMFVWSSVLLFVVAQLAEFALFESFVASISSSAPGGLSASQVQGAFDGLLRGAIVVVAMAAISSALIAFALMDSIGRLLAIGAVALQIVISVVVYLVILGPIIRQAITDAFASGTYNPAPIAAADAAITGLAAYSLLDALPAIMFAIAYYRARTSVGRSLKPAWTNTWATPKAPSPPVP
jgi:hypothetical protein